MPFATKALIAALMVTTPVSFALAQAPASPETATQWSADQAAAHLTELGFTRVTLDDTEGNHYEFEAFDADGRDIDIDVGFDGTILSFDVDDDERATNADLIPLLPQAVQDAIAVRGITDVTEYNQGRSRYTIEGYTAEGREIEVEFSIDNTADTVSVDDGRGPAPQDVDLEAAVNAVEASGYQVSDVERRPNHLELRATNPEGEEVRLHTDFSGAVYRELLVR